MLEFAFRIKRGAAIEVYALDEWLPATFVKVRKDSAWIVNVPGVGDNLTTTRHSVRLLRKNAA